MESAEPDMASEPNVLFDLFARGVEFLQAHGWTLVFLVISFYVVRPYFLAYKAKREQAASLAFANEPNRRRVLDDDLRRVRLAQLRQQQEASRLKKQKDEELRQKRDEERAAKAQEEEKSKRDDDARPRPSRPVGDNPWADLGSSQTSSVAPAPRVQSRRPDTGYNPLNGGGGLGGYRPRRITPRRG